MKAKIIVLFLPFCLSPDYLFEVSTVFIWFDFLPLHLLHAIPSLYDSCYSAFLLFTTLSICSLSLAYISSFQIRQKNWIYEKNNCSAGIFVGLDGRYIIRKHYISAGETENTENH